MHLLNPKAMLILTPQSSQKRKKSNKYYCTPKELSNMKLH